MQLRKIISAGVLSVLMAGSTVAFAQDLGAYPAPFVSGSTVDALIVVGSGPATGADAAGLASDVVAGIDVATRLGGEATEPVSIAGGTTAEVSGEGQNIATKNTQVYLDDSMGKSGLRTTMTKDDLPNILASGTLDDVDAATTHNFQQFIFLTPSDSTCTSNDENYCLQYEIPGSSSGADPDYSIGRFPTSPTTSNYFYRTQVVFDKEVNGTTAIGEKLNIFGGTYTITSGTDFTASSPKLVLAGGADSVILNGQETTTVIISGTTYEITLDGVTSTPKALVTVTNTATGASDQREVSVSAKATIAGLDVFVDRATQLSTTDQTQNSAKLLLGAETLTFEDGQRVTQGTEADPIDGTLVSITTSNGKMSTLTVYFGAQSSTNDFIKTGTPYENQLWKTFSVSLDSLSPGVKDASRNILTVRNSGDNLLQSTIIDDSGDSATVTWAYKSGSTSKQFKLGDNSGDDIIVVENQTINRDQYVVLDAGGFSRLFEVTTVNLDGSANARIDLRDIFSGNSVRVSTSSDNVDAKVIDGQTYNFYNVSSTSFKVTWGAGAGNNDIGDFITVWPVLKGKNDERIAFINATPVTLSAVDGRKYQLPGGAFNVTVIDTGNITIAAVSQEDGTSSALGTGSNTTIDLLLSENTTFSLGRTSTGGTKYNLVGTGSLAFTLQPLADQDASIGGGGVALSQPALLVVEEKDDAGNEYSVLLPATTETSGSSNVASAAAPEFTAGEDSATWGSDSDVTSYVDVWGTYVEVDSQGQNSLSLYYPDDQVTANIFVLGDDAVVSTDTIATTTVNKAVPIKTSIAKLDSEVTASDKTSKNLILVGGPVVNSLVGDLATAGKTQDTSWYVDQGQGTSLLDYVDGAFASGKVALVVAGHSAADTREAAKWLQQYDSHASDLAGQTRVVLKNGVLTTTTA